MRSSGGRIVAPAATVDPASAAWSAREGAARVLFNSAGFLFGFLPVAVAGYFAAGRMGERAALLWLIAASLVFYGWFDARFVPLLAASVGFNHAAGRLLVATRGRPRAQAWVLRAAVTADLAALVGCKYLAWLAGLLTGTGLVQIPLPSPILPLGISFFTFTQIGYLRDVRDDPGAPCGVLRYAGFVTLFPALIAGPILRIREIAPQFADPAARRFSTDALSVGIGIFILGLLKKTLLADPLAGGVGEAFAQPAALPLFAAWQAALRYSLQLYFDFSGYSDMAIGLARMFNLRLPLNFNAPYRARSVIEYWSRWHMTLTRFLTRHLHDPLSLHVMRRRRAHGAPVNRAAQARPAGFAAMHALPVFVTLGLAGLWHGSGAQFLVFGLLHALYLTVNRAWRLLRGVRPSPGPIGNLWRVALTYGCVLVGSVFFRAASVADALAMLGGMVGLHGAGPPLALPLDPVWPGGSWLLTHGWVSLGDWHDAAQTGRSLLWLVLLYAIVWCAPTTQQIFARAAPALSAGDAAARWSWRPTLPWAIAFGALGTIGLLSLGGTGEFLYFQF
jgi:alginate O-acetyltransferase complex protein AlgI